MAARLEVARTTLGNAKYWRAVELRFNAFFAESADPLPLLFDEFENDSIHLVALAPEEAATVVGYIRLSKLSETIGKASQLVVAEHHRGHEAWRLLIATLISTARPLGIQTIDASARIRGIPLYKRLGFRVVGDAFPSPKTGVLHQPIQLIL